MARLSVLQFFTVPAAVVLFCLVAVTPEVGFSKAVTAPHSPDQTLINPAAATTRSHRSYLIQLHRDQDQLKALNLVSSTYQTETVVDTLQANAALKFGDVFAEVNISPQLGERNTTSSYESGTFGNSTSAAKNTISLNPIQVILATRMGRDLSVGIKVLYTYTDFHTVDGYKYVTGYDLVTSSGDQSNNVQFNVLSGGLTYNLVGNLYLGYTAELTQITTNGNSLSTTDQRDTTTAAIRTYRTESGSTNKVLKNVVGLSYLTKGSGSDSLRLEASYEKIPPLVKTSPLQDGELYRLIAEATWSYFHFGVEGWSKKGYYVDPYNLIPYFFDPDKLSNDAVTEYGVFGGLRLSRGQSFGLSFFQSTEQKREKLSPSSPSETDTELTSQTFGVSYSSVF